MPKTAMVLAAGLGKRMRPLTDQLPKPLVALAGRPLIDHVLARLSEAGVTNAVVNVHHMADQIEAHLAGRTEPAIQISDERGELLDTGGGVVRARTKLGNGPFFIHNSDSVWIEGKKPCLQRMVEAWDADTMDTLLLLAPVANTLGYSGQGDFAMDARGIVRRPEAGEVVPYVFTGVSIAHPRLFENAPDGKFSMNLLWDRAIAAARVHGISHDGVWMHVGTPEAVREAEERLRREHA